MTLTETQDGKIIVAGRCRITGEEYATEPISQESLAMWHSGRSIRDILPTVKEEDRQFIKTGISPAGWKKMVRGG